MSNKSIARQFFERYGGQHDVEGVLELFGPGFRVSGSVMPGGSGDVEAYRQLGYAYLAGFPDLTVEVLEQIEEGDRVVTRVRWGGTNNGSLQGMPPTGQTFSSEAITIDRIADGKIIERVEVSDLLGMLQQLGVIPALA